MSVFEGYLRIRILCADLERILSALTEKGIDLTNIVRKDYLTAEVTVLQRDYKVMKRTLDKLDVNYRVLSHRGFLWSAHSAMRRPVLVLGLVLFILFLPFISKRIFFINIIGNTCVPTAEILNHAENCGIRFGVKSADIRSEDTKNALMQKIPELQWVGVTTSGTVATIHVKERSVDERIDTAKTQSYGIYADRDGMIAEMVVKRGTPLVSVGEQVREGDLLVSGYTDCGIKIRFETPDAEIFAHTTRENSFVTLPETKIRTQTKGEHRCFSIRIGKKVINLCNHSGIHDTTCVKMYEEDYWTLPGGFRLPISVKQITYRYYGTRKSEVMDVSQWLPQFATRYLQQQMIAGEILQEVLFWPNPFELIGTYVCREMIGQVKSEEKFNHNAEDN